MAAVAGAQLEAKKYARLLGCSLPSVIEIKEENERMLAEVERQKSRTGSEKYGRR
jgi:uncharacterized protein YggE